jgi:hypothetical protein
MQLQINICFNNVYVILIKNQFFVDAIFCIYAIKSGIDHRIRMIILMTRPVMRYTMFQMPPNLVIGSRICCLHALGVMLVGSVLSSAFMGRASGLKYGASNAKPLGVQSFGDAVATLGGFLVRYVCFKCLVSSEQLLYIDKSYKSEMEDFERIKSITEEAMKTNVKNTTIIHNWRR